MISWRCHNTLSFHTSCVLMLRFMHLTDKNMAPLLRGCLSWLVAFSQRGFFRCLFAMQCWVHFQLGMVA
jgi:hypothetical protein